MDYNYLQIPMLKKLAVKMFGNLTEQYLDYFESLKLNLKKGIMTYTLHEYLSLILLVSLITFIASAILGAALITFIIPPAPTSIFYSYTTAFILSIILTAGMFLLGYYYPSIKARSIKSKIDRGLPFAVFYMATAASSGINPSDIFKLLSERGGIIGNEAKKIYSDVTSLGLSLATAVHRAAVRSPSSLFSDLLYGLSSIITSGGNIEEYLKGKTRTFMAQYRRMLEEYSDKIALYTEIYVTLVIVGSLFFIILIAIVSPLVGGTTLFIQSFLIFFVIPLVSLGFLMLLRAISPLD